MSASGVWSGYAWSDNVGWISFNPKDWGACPPVGSCSAYSSYPNTLSGHAWARVLSVVGSGNAGGFDGWIALNGTYGSSSSFGLDNITSATDQTSGYFSGYKMKIISFNKTGSTRTAGSGYGYGGNVVGWLDFSVSDQISAGIYAGPAVTPPSCTTNCSPVKAGNIKINANPILVDSGQQTRLSWYSPANTTTFTSCTGSGGGSDWSKSQSTPTASNKIRYLNVNVPSNITTFTISCNYTVAGVTKTATDSVDVYINPASVTSLSHGITLSANPGVVDSGNTTTLTWTSSTNTTYASCVGSGGGPDWNGQSLNVLSSSNSYSESKSSVTVPGSPGTGAVYTISCTTAGGVTDKAITTVAINSNSSTVGLDLYAVPASVASNTDTTTLSWDSPTGTMFTGGCTASGGGTDWDATAPSAPTITTPTQSQSSVTVPNNPTTYTISCVDGSGNVAYASTDVAVDSTPPDLTLGADKSSINYGDTVTLTYASTSAYNNPYVSCEASGGDSTWDTSQGTFLTPLDNTTGSTSSNFISVSGINVPTVPYTDFVITCTTANGDTQTATTRVNVNNTITATLSASPSTIVSGNSTALTITTTGSTSNTACASSGGTPSVTWSRDTTDPNIWTGSASPTVDTTYTVTCSDTAFSTSVDASTDVKLLSIVSFAKSGLNSCYYNSTPATMPAFYWSTKNAYSCDLIAPNGTDTNIGVSGGNTFTTKGGTGSYALKCYTDTTKVSYVTASTSVNACSPTFDVVGSVNKCTTGSTGNTFVQTGGTGPYKATVTFVGTPKYGFTSNLALTVTSLLAGTTATANPATSQYSWSGITPTSSATSAGSYTQNLTITIPANQYNTFINGLTKQYGNLKITASDGTTSKVATYGLCGTGATLPRPIFKEF